MTSLLQKKSFIIRIALSSIALLALDVLIKALFDLSTIESFTKDQVKSRSKGDLIFYTIIFAPLFETFLFQYLPFLLLKNRNSNLYIISSGLIFGISHYILVKDELFILFGALIVGFYLSYLYVIITKAYSLNKWTPFLGTSLAHMLLNTITIIYMSYNSN